MCPWCEREGKIGYGQYEHTLAHNGHTYDIYRCYTITGKGCGRRFSVKDQDTHEGRQLTYPLWPKQEAPVRFSERLGRAWQQEERTAPPYQPSNRWLENACEGHWGVMIWWPKGISQERREHFMKEAMQLLGKLGRVDDEEVYATADNLYRMWINWIKS